LKPTSLSLPSVATALLAAAVLAIATIAQAPQAAPPAAGSPPPPRVYPAPTNLKVLPKDLTGQQVHEIMEKWEGSLGAKCNTCHTPDPNNIAPNGRPRLNFVDDSKKEKAAARLMYTMTEEINRSYVAKIDSSGAPVTCGTCHRGHLGPEPFVIPPEDGPRPPPSPPPAEIKPPQPK
jgi:cytochrome c553